LVAARTDRLGSGCLTPDTFADTFAWLGTVLAERRRSAKARNNLQSRRDLWPDPGAG
jgi:hypothetical protein